MCIRTTEATAALQARIIRYDSREGLAQELGVNSAHVHKLFQRGRLSPTLDNAMVRRGWIEPKPTRVRTAFNSTVEMQQWAANERARRGIDSQQLLVDMRGAYEWVMTTAQDVLMRKTSIDCDEATCQWFREEAARRRMSGEAFLLYMREVLR